jgi:hypothetical protein
VSGAEAKRACGSTTSFLYGREAVSQNRTSGSCAKAARAAHLEELRRLSCCYMLNTS